MKKISNLVTSLLFLMFIFSAGAYILLTEDKDVSKVENRPLAEMPEVQWDSILSGEYTAAYDEYIVDQFPLRDTWIKSYLQWQIWSNQTFIHDYYLADDWVYPRPFTEIDYDAIDYAVEKVINLNDFIRKRNIELYFFSIPDRRFMIDMQFPKRVENEILEQDKELLLSQFPKKPMHTIDIGMKWQEKWNKENYRDFYFRTDHHWNADGAFLAFEEIYDVLSDRSTVFPNQAFNRKDYDKNCLQDKEFIGSYNRQLYNYINAEGEQMCQYLPSENELTDWSVYSHELKDENELQFTDVFGLSDPQSYSSVSYSDIYAYDYDELHFINPHEKNKALVLKDSYVNALLPLIADNFHQTTFYDVRHNEGRDLYSYIEEHDFDIVMLLYSNGRTLFELYEWEEK